MKLTKKRIDLMGSPTRFESKWTVRPDMTGCAWYWTSERECRCQDWNGHVDIKFTDNAFTKLLEEKKHIVVSMLDAANFIANTMEKK